MNKLIRFVLVSLKVIVDLLGDIFYKFNIVLWPLNPEEIINSQSKDVQLDLQNNPRVKRNLIEWVKCLSGNNCLSATGRIFSKILVQDILSHRLEIHRCLREDPSIRHVPIKRPVFIVTLLRTGSTFIHCLMAQDQQWRCPKLWELEDCAPPPGGQDNNDEKRLRKSLFKWDMAAIGMGWNDVRSAHHFNADSPEDLLFLYHSDFLFILTTINFETLELEYENYIRNPPKEDQLAFERNVKTRLQMVCKNSDMENRRLLTMLHSTGAQLDTLLEVFPDAQIITIHRDPVQIVKSTCQLTSLTRRVATRFFQEDNVGVGRRSLNTLKADVAKFLKWRKSKSLETEQFKRFIDVQFKDLVEKPIETLQHVYKDLNANLDDTAKRNMEIYLKQIQEKKSTNRKNVNLETFGLNEKFVRETFKTYTDYFNIN